MLCLFSVFSDVWSDPKNCFIKCLYFCFRIVCKWAQSLSYSTTYVHAGNPQLGFHAVNLMHLYCLPLTLRSQSVSNSWQTVADHVKTTEFTVKDLRPNTVYLFIIRAVNAQGLGDPSPMSEPVRTQGTDIRMECAESSAISITIPLHMPASLSLSQTSVPRHREWTTGACRRS